MTEKTHAVPNGVIHYWMKDFQPGRAVLVFLPGLTADHRLFDKQVEAFESTYNPVSYTHLPLHRPPPWGWRCFCLLAN